MKDLKFIPVLLSALYSSTFALELSVGGACFSKHFGYNGYNPDSPVMLGKCGDDASTIAVVEDTVILAVADGASDRNQVSGPLILTTATGFEANPNDLGKIFDALVQKSKDREVDPLDTIAGLSTYTAAFISTKTGILRTLNVGDSSTFVIRGGEMIFKTEPTTIGFNRPYGIAEYKYSKLFTGFDQLVMKQLPGRLQPGDIVMSASDGLLDNIYVDELIPYIEKMLSKGKELGENISQYLANSLSKHIRRCMTEEQERMRPFWVAYRDYVGGELNASSQQKARFGKRDDFSVVIAIIE